MKLTTHPTQSDWQAWGRPEWSDHLLRHLFGTERTASPVAFVPATRFDLQRAVGDPAADPAEVEVAFVRALAASPIRVRDILSVRSAEFLESRRSPSTPGYLADLVLTCYVASGGDEETVSEGQFRERLRQTLRHPEGTTYDLADLGTLWEAFAEWLERRAPAGTVRPLRLPDPGHMNRIGYSLRLAFPTLRDRRVLADAFADLRGEAPSMREAVRRVRVRRADFGDRSQVPAVLDDFTRRLVTGDLDLWDHPFWAAVRDAVALDFGPAAGADALRVGLIVEDPAALDLSSLAVGVTHPEGLMPPMGVEFSALPTAIGGFQKVLDFDPGPDPVSALLAGHVSTYWPPLAQTPAARMAAQGALTFARDEAHWPTSRASLPAPGCAVWLLCRSAVLDRVLPHVLGDAPVPSSDSAYEGWGWVGPLDAGRLHGLGERFRALDALQPTAPPPPVRLGGGVRTGSSYLGVPGALPHVTAPTATRAERTDSRTGQATGLVGSGGRFEDRTHEAVRGDHSYAAYDSSGHVVGRTHARFVGVHVDVDYKRPRPGDWLVEGVTSEVEPWRNSDDVLDRLADLGGQDGFPPGPDGVVDFDASGLIGDVPTSPFTDDAAPVPGLAPFVEVMAARSVARAGVSEAEVLRLLLNVVGVPEGPVLWEAARAWAEAGYLDVLSPRSWPSRTYVARRPSLVVWNGSGGLHATLVGLAPAEVRGRVAAHAPRVGGAVVARTPASRWVLDPLVVRVPSADAAADLARRSELPPPARLQPLTTLDGSPAEVVTRVDGSPPERYGWHDEWNWSQGYFGRPAGEERVTLSRWTLPRSPTRYLVEAVGVSRSFRSRTWAFLYALALRGELAWIPDALGRLTTAGPTRAHLPVPLARALATVGGAPGPRTTIGGRVEYVRPTTPDSFSALTAWLGGRRITPPSAADLARRLRARLTSAPGVPMPRDLQARLEPHAHDPDVAALLTSRFPATLMPHVARLAVTLSSDR